jgi:hypothetical protein
MTDNLIADTAYLLFVEFTNTTHLNNWRAGAVIRSRAVWRTSSVPG